MRYARGFTHGIALGVGAMFLFDPQRGAARRAYVRDKSLRAVHEVKAAIGIGTRDLTHRIDGAIARALSSSEEEEVDDDTLVARVRSRLGHVCSHAGSIDVVPKGGGYVELRGPVLTSEASRIVAAVSRVPGVRAVDDELERHGSAAEVPELERSIERPSALAKLLSPSARLAFGGAAALGALGALAFGHPVGSVGGGVAALAIARSIARRNTSVHRPRAHRAPDLRPAAQPKARPGMIGTGPSSSVSSPR